MKLALALMLALGSGTALAAKQTHIVDERVYCGTLEVAPPFVGMRDASPGSCGVVPPDPAGRQLTATIKYPNVPGSGVRTIDITRWDNLFGHRDSIDGITPWPGANGSSPAVVQFTGPGYVALDAMPNVKAQVMVNISSYNGAVLDGAWSTQVGDFSGNVKGNVAGACTATRGPGESFPKLSTDPTKPGCYIALGQHVVFNVRLHVPQPAPKTVQFNMTSVVY